MEAASNLISRDTHPGSSGLRWPTCGDGGSALVAATQHKTVQKQLWLLGMKAAKSPCPCDTTSTRHPADRNLKPSWAQMKQNHISSGTKTLTRSFTRNDFQQKSKGSVDSINTKTKVIKSTKLVAIPLQSIHSSITNHFVFWAAWCLQVLWFLKRE